MGVQDTLQEMASTVVCPSCASENLEGLPGAEAMETPEYRCLDCGTEFNGGGDLTL